MNKHDLYNLTKPQESIWISEKFSNTPANNIMGTAYFNSSIDILLLKKAAHNNVQNNQALRTKLILNNDSGMPQQYFDNSEEFDIPVIDFSSKTMADFKQLQKDFAQKRFNLIENFLFDFIIVILPNDEISFIGKFHHLIADAWSLGLFMDNLAINYTRLADNSFNFNLISNNYTNFIDREKKYISSDSYNKNKLFWSNILKNTNPINIKNKLQNSYKANRVSFDFTKSDSLCLDQFCKTHNISPYILFLCALQIYLYRTTMQKDFSIASPILNRAAKEKFIIGMFVNMISIPMHTNPDCTIADLLNSISSNMFSCLKNSKYPYMDLLNDSASSQRYNIVFSFQNMRPNNNIENLVKYHLEWNFSDYSFDDLVINVTDINNNGTYSIEYDYLVNIFDESEIKYIHSRIYAILKEIINNTDTKISDIQIINDNEKEKILSFSSGNTLNYDKSLTVVKLFEQTVKKHPNEIALAHANTSLTYTELCNMSNIIAKAIHEKDLYNCRIAIMCRKSIFMVASLLGIMKSGNCYIPIDPEYPEERINYIMENCNCKLLITTSDLQEQVSCNSKIILNNLDFSKQINFEDKSLPDNLAYMIYTSGTTGNPKGVKIKHKNIVNTLLWRKNYYKFSTKDAILQIPSFSFDSSVEDIFTPLISGSKLVIPTSSKIDINSISEDIEKNKVTHFLVVPSLYKVLLHEKYDCLKYLSIVTIAGESFPSTLLGEHFEKLPNVRIVNEYGPTENSVCSTYYEMTKEDNTIFIGKAIDNCYTYCLDDNLNLLPIGIDGELYVSGPGVSDGYFNKDELTKERFIENPFVKNLKMYKTGDIVRLHENGLLEFIGRKDNQVKLHGFRIELNEIEKVILDCPEIKDVKVLIKELKKDKNSLIAYIISDNPNLNINDIYYAIRKKLPYYMIPTIMQIEKFPLTPNGKLNTNKLPIPNIIKKSTAKPESELEYKILEVCQKVLKNSDLGVEDDLFIDAGADSLNILTISSKLFSANINIGIQSFYKYPSVRQLCKFLSSREYGAKTSKKNIIEPPHTEFDINLFKDSLYFKYNNIFLTGVTGFFGAHTLYQLLQNTKCFIYCLVRKKYNKSAKDRIINILNYYFGESFYNNYKNRIVIIDGELDIDNFGLSNYDYSNLQKEIDCVINTAAITKHYGSANIFYKENIKTVKNLIKFCINKNILFNHISTTTVSGNFLVSNNLSCNFDENSFYIGQNYEDNMYVFSKFEAERLILEAEKNGLKANIFRLGNLMARHSDGQFQKNKLDNAYYCRLIALAKLGCLPNTLINQQLEFTPIDDASLAVVKLLTIPNLSNKIFHIFTNKLISINVLLNVLSRLGNNCRFVDYDDFMKILYSKENEKLLALIVSDINENNKINYASEINIKHEITNKYLEKLGFSWHNIDTQYLLNFFEKNNFVNDLK